MTTPRHCFQRECFFQHSDNLWKILPSRMFTFGNDNLSTKKFDLYIVPDAGKGNLNMCHKCDSILAPSRMQKHLRAGCKIFHFLKSDSFAPAVEGIWCQNSRNSTMEWVHLLQKRHHGIRVSVHFQATESVFSAFVSRFCINCIKIVGESYERLRPWLEVLNQILICSSSSSL